MSEPVGIMFTNTDEREVLIPAIESLYLHPGRRPLEVVLVDNASSDGARDEVAGRWPQVRILVQDRRYGLSANINRGMAETHSPYLMLCDSDMIFRAGTVDALADFLDGHSGCGIVKPKLVSPDGELRASARRWYTLASLIALRGPWRGLVAKTSLVGLSRYADWDYREARVVDWVPFAGAMVRRAPFEEAGGVDESFPFYFEDVDLSLRMWQAGWEVWCEPAAEMVHLENRASLKPFSRAWWWHLESLLRFWWKHRGLRPKERPARVAG